MTVKSMINKAVEAFSPHTVESLTALAADTREQLTALENHEDIDHAAAESIKLRSKLQIIEARLDGLRKKARADRFAALLAELEAVEQKRKADEKAYIAGKDKYLAELQKTHKPGIAKRMAKDSQTWPTWLNALRIESQKHYGRTTAVRETIALEFPAEGKAAGILPVPYGAEM